MNRRWTRVSHLLLPAAVLAAAFLWSLAPATEDVDDEPTATEAAPEESAAESRPAALASQPAQPKMSGFFLLTPMRRPPPQRALISPFIDGFVLDAGWIEMEKTDGQYTWPKEREFWGPIKRARKKAGIRVTPGFYTPRWVLARKIEKIETFNYRNVDLELLGRNVSLPIPWNAEFLKLWRRFVTELGKQCASHPELACVHVAGPNAYSPEMWLPGRPPEMEQWKNLEYDADKLVDAWRKCIDMFAEAFPADCALVLELSDEALLDDGVTQKVSAYAADKYGKRVVLLYQPLEPYDRKAGYSEQDPGVPGLRVMKELGGKVSLGFLTGSRAWFRRNIDSGPQLFRQGFEFAARTFPVDCIEFFPEAFDIHPDLIKDGAELFKTRAKGPPAGATKTEPQPADP